MSRKSVAPAADQLYKILRNQFSLQEFRPGQQEAVEAVLGGKDALVVMPTGSGKSLIYQLPALLLPGLTVVVSPLIALMKDQTDKLGELGVDARAINSTLTDREKAAEEEAVEQGDGKILYVTPERFRDRDFFEVLLGREVSLFVVDEAHCISQWGHDFRPDYMMMGSIAHRLGRPPILALTATAPPEVQDDIIDQLGMEKPFRVIGELIRPNLQLEVIPAVNDEVKRVELERILRGSEGGGIIYTATVREAERLYAELSDRWPLALYHGKRTARQREEAQNAWAAGEVKAVIATGYERIHRSNLVGMGVLPLQFHSGDSAQSLGLTGHEVFDITGVAPDGPAPGSPVQVVATSPDGAVTRFEVIARLDSDIDVDYYRNGGILHTVLRKMGRGEM